MDNKWSAPWNTAIPIKHYFKGLEEMFILATKYSSKYTMGQMVKKAKTAMERCGLFQWHLNKWSQFILPHQDWNNMKQHFGETYENRLISGRGVGVPGTITNAQELSNKKDDSINTITDIMSSSKISKLPRTPHRTSASATRKRVEAEEADDVGVKLVEEEAVATRGHWHPHSIHCPDLDSKLHQQLHQASTSTPTIGTCTSAVDLTYQVGTQAKPAPYHAARNTIMMDAIAPTIFSTRRRDTE